MITSVVQSWRNDFKNQLLKNIFGDKMIKKLQPIRVKFEMQGELDALIHIKY